MGEIADMMLDGTLCEGCGVYLEGGDGFPRRCASCQCEERENAPLIQPSNPNKVACPICRRHVRATGLKDHMRDKHRSGQPAATKPAGAS